VLNTVAHQLKIFDLMKRLIFSSLLAVAASSAYAQVSIDQAWTRATVPGQPVGAVYMTINSPTQVTLLQAETDAAKDVQIHTMHHHDGVMRMREHGQIQIIPDKPVTLAPGGMHLMLIGLKAPLKAGESVDVKLTFKDAKGVVSHTTISAPVKPIGH
jgi:copper(I)-binding protein